MKNETKSSFDFVMNPSMADTMAYESKRMKQNIIKKPIKKKRKKMKNWQNY